MHYCQIVSGKVIIAVCLSLTVMLFLAPVLTADRELLEPRSAVDTTDLAEKTTAVGPFDLETATASGYKGLIDSLGFRFALGSQSNERVAMPEESESETRNPTNGYWSTLGSGVAGGNKYIYALATYNNKLIAGGDFATAGGVSASNIAAWDGSSWSALSSGMNYHVNALTVYKNKLIAGGYFTTAGGLSCSHLAVWNGSSWRPLGTGIDGEVYALAVYRGQLIAGGDFGSAGTVAANNIAAWNGNSWSALASGVSGGNDYVYTLAVFNGQLYAGGNFTTAGSAPAQSIAAWNGSSWSSLGSGLSGGIGDTYVFALTLFQEKLIVGGSFFDAGGTGAFDVAAWNGSSWSTVGCSYPDCELYPQVQGLNTYNGRLIACGAIIIQGTCGPAAWDGTSWTVLGTGISGGSNIARPLLVYSNRLIVGGGFTQAGGIPASGIAAWSEGGIQYGNVSGTVTSSGLGAPPIDGTNVVLTDRPEYSAKTDAQGQYSITRVPAGTYTIGASKSGYTSQQLSVQVTEGQRGIVNSCGLVF